MKIYRRKLCYLLTLIILVVSVSGCSNLSSLERHTAEFLNLFDTVTEIIAYTDTKETFTDEAQFFHDELEKYHELYDIYNTYEGINNVKTINDNAGIQPVKVDQKIIDLLLLGGELFDKTDGKINLAFGSVLSIWHEYREQGIDDPHNAKIPSMEELEKAFQYTDFKKVIIDEEKSTVYLEDPNMSLDVGALAKGYAVEQVCRTAEEKGYMHVLVSVGGNVRAIGDKPVDDFWKVGIQNPDKESTEPFINKVNLNGLSLVTSGDYQRYYTVAGQEYHHIIDPNTLMPADYFSAVSILCKDSGLADGISTAVYNMDYEEGSAFIESIPDVEAVWVNHDGTLLYSSGFEQYILE